MPRRLEEEDLETVDDHVTAGRSRRRDQSGVTPVRKIGEIDDLHPGVWRHDHLVLNRRRVDEDVVAVGRWRPAGVASARDRHVGPCTLERLYDRPGAAARPEHESAPVPGIDLRRDCVAVGRGAQHAAVVEDERVDRPGRQRDLVELVAERNHGLLVGNRHVRTGETHRLQAPHRVGEPLRRRRQGHVGPVERQGGKPGVLHRRRQRVRRRPAEQADERRRATDVDRLGLDHLGSIPDGRDPPTLTPPLSCRRSRTRTPCAGTRSRSR